MSKIASSISLLKKRFQIALKLFYNKPSIPVSDIAKETLAMITIIVIVFFAILFVVGLRSYFVIIEPFEVPAKLAENGYTGKTIVNRISFALDEISNDSGFKINGTVVSTGSATVPDVAIPVSSNSLRSMIVNFKQLFGNRIPTVTGDIVNINNNLKMLVRVSGDNKYIKPKNKFITDPGNDIEKLAQGAAEIIYAQIQPYVLVGYYINNGYYTFGSEVLQAVRIKARDAGYANLQWAYCLYMTKNYNKAIEKIELASKSTNSADSYNNIYRVWGYILRKQCKFDDAIKKFDYAIDLLPSDSFSYSGKGNILKLQKKYAEAILNLNKAIELNSENVGAKMDLKEISIILEPRKDPNASYLRLSKQPKP